MDDGYNHSKKAGNEGDVIKHSFLLDTVDHLISEKVGSNDPFWYVDTHTAYPHHRLPSSGSSGWTKGIGKLKKAASLLPTILANYLDFSFYEENLLTNKKPAFTGLGARLYLGSSALVCQRFKHLAPGRPLLLSLFDIDADVVQALHAYFAQDEFQPVALILGNRQLGDQAASALNEFWKALGEPRCLVIQGSSYDYFSEICPDKGEQRPNLVFVDPHILGDDRVHVERILASCSRTNTPFMCWTPLQGVGDKKFSKDDWSFERNEDEMSFVETCKGNDYRIAWFAWNTVTNGRQNCYGCQLTFPSTYDVTRLRTLCDKVRAACQDAGIRTQQGHFRVKVWPE